MLEIRELARQLCADPSHFTQGTQTPMRRAVITGSQGFIGRRLAAKLCLHGWTVLGLGAKPGHSAGNLAGGYHCWDGLDPGKVLPENWPNEPFTLIDLAWNTDRPPEFHPHALHVNRLANTLDSLAKRGLAAVVGVGTAEEYGQRAGVLCEDDPTDERLNAYGWGKQAAGAMLRIWSEAHGVPAYWMRPFLVYGPGQKTNMVVPYAFRQALHNEIARFSDGRQQRDFIFVDDVADALAAAAENPPAGFEIVNVGTGKPTPVRDVLTEIAEQLRVRDRFRFGEVPRRAGEAEFQVAGTGKACELLGWRARVDWRTGIRLIVESLNGSEHPSHTWSSPKRRVHGGP